MGRDSSSEDTARELVRLRDRLRVLSEVTRCFAEATTDYQRLLESIARSVAETIRDSCTVFLIDPQQGSLGLSAMHAADPEVLRVLKQDFGTRKLSMTEQPAVAERLQRGEAILVPRLAGRENTPEQSRWQDKLGLHSTLVVPLRVQGRFLGILTLGRFRPEAPPFDEDDVELAQNLADHASLAIENARLYANAADAHRDAERAEQRRDSLEQQLRQAQKLEAIGRLAGGIAHDFNNLLSIVLGYSEDLLSDLPDGSSMRPDLLEIQLAANRAAQLTRQLLMFSRQQVVEPKVLDLNEVLEDMQRMLARVLGEQLELVVLPGTGLGRIRADRGNIEQVIMNLAVNARDAMSGSGRLTIETSNATVDEDFVRQHFGAKPGHYVFLGVTDTGTGMDAETRQQIFEPFFSTKERGKGTGLGLSTVLGIVQQAGGGVWVYSEPGHGTAFKIYLPRVEAELDATPSPDSAADLRGTETLLLVEDEQAVREVARRILERHGYTVLAAQSPADALSLGKSHAGPIDLLLTDVVMPQMTGTGLAERLLALRPAIKVLYMSGYTDGSIGAQGVLEDGTAFVQKPFTSELLSRKVRSALDAG